jgi:small subunit ribosomal protein S18
LPLPARQFILEPAGRSILPRAHGRKGGTEESKEETLCLKKLKERRPKRAQQQHPDRIRPWFKVPVQVPQAPAPADGHAPAADPGGRPSGGPGGRGKFFRRKKVCKFCTEKIDAIPYRDVRLLQGFVAERGKIVPRRLTGVCTTHQRRLTRAIKQARNIALLPFATRH